MDLKTFQSAIEQLELERGIPKEKILETIEMALAAAYKRDYGKRGQIIKASFNPKTGDVEFAQIKIVVDESMLKPEEDAEASEEETTKPETKTEEEKTSGEEKSE
jgi:N utilization substance protein A